MSCRTDTSARASGVITTDGDLVERECAFTLQRVRAVRERVLSSERWMQTAMTTNDSSEAQRLYLNRCRSFNLELGLEPRKINIADCVTA